MDLPTKTAEQLANHGQTHLVRFWDELSDREQRSLLGQIEQVDFDLIGRLAALSIDAGDKDRAERARSPENLVRQPRTDADAAEWAQAAQAGRELLRAGKVGAILVAGGQGTRLGFDKPKGMFPIGPVSGKSLYQWFAEQLRARAHEARNAIPYFIMTSDATHAETVAFFEANHFFGLNPADVFFFEQGTLPAVEQASPRILLDQKGSLSLSPDGHGGLLKALDRHGLLEEMARRGIELLYYHQVDNATAVFCDPAFLGWHSIRGSEASTKVVAKVSPEERMGVVCSVDGQTQIIEYSDLTPEQSRIKEEDGSDRFWAGNTAIHVFSRAFLSRLVDDGIDLPYHIARKAVPYVDDGGTRVAPAAPNARKFEQFVFDSLPLAKNALVVEADRAAEFNPVKNKDGADSPATAKAALSANHRRWLEAAGAKVATGVTVELGPLFALDAAQAAGRVSPGTKFDQDAVLDHPA